MKRFVALLAVALGLIWPATVLVTAPAHALSCVGPAAVFKDSDVVVHGHIVDSRDQHLIVAVDEVWKGRNLPPRMQFTVDAVNWTPWADGDELRDGISDKRGWVFAPDHEGAISICTSWRDDVDGLAALRPAKPAVPMGDTDVANSPGLVAPAASTPAWPYLGGGAFLTAAAVAVAGLRFRRVD